MFDGDYERRLISWRAFRLSLEDSDNPIQETIDAWNTMPIKGMCTDPYDANAWPNPWEILLANEVCDFVKILGICYTLQLTDRFSGSDFEINISIDEKKSRLYYLLFVDTYAIGYYNDTYVKKSQIPKLKCQFRHCMPSLQ